MLLSTFRVKLPVIEHCHLRCQRRGHTGRCSFDYRGGEGGGLVAQTPEGTFSAVLKQIFCNSRLVLIFSYFFYIPRDLRTYPPLYLGFELLHCSKCNICRSLHHLQLVGEYCSRVWVDTSNYFQDLCKFRWNLTKTATCFKHFTDFAGIPGNPRHLPEVSAFCRFL